MERVNTLKAKDDESIVAEDTNVTNDEENNEIQNETSTEPSTVAYTENTMDILPSMENTSTSNNDTHENN